ncbi:MAG: hypothetical protein AB7O97_18970 [Planctomycetota bacterium]
MARPSERTATQDRDPPRPADEQPAPPPPSLSTRVLRNGAGVLLLLAGIAGLFLPILQGVIMIVGGLALIDLPIKHRAHARLMRWAWYRRLAARHDDLLAKWRAWRARRRGDA